MQLITNCSSHLLQLVERSLPKISLVRRVPEEEFFDSLNAYLSSQSFTFLRPFKSC